MVLSSVSGLRLCIDSVADAGDRGDDPRLTETLAQC